ncbi:poly-beta-1,6 N-acetyl-D-glucosamine export porin PgaA [Acinetobacter larvae]|uniref:Poly-beta-1,6 N-acetyl-D-glucosamine export porin PgaA n=1 Tax=Acinetobacter larvae TaxID=1789224 RepID=A0A1B2M3X4_9GAMM|nr:poly-beta-1,6 N-acetyl-D-glucosamine export porin PgaA [Acinetobacter larvae]
MCSALTTHGYATPLPNVTQQREQAVALYYSGSTTESLKRLQQLLALYPADNLLLADYLMLRAQLQAFDQADLVRLSAIQLDTFPSYAYAAVLQGLRHAAQYQLALDWAKRFQQQQPSLNIAVLQAVLYAEATQKEPAMAHLKALVWSELNLSELLAVSYAYRLLDQPIESLNVVQKAYAIQADHAAMLEEYVYVLMALGNSTQALSLLEGSDLAQQNPDLVRDVQLQELSKRIRDAIQRYKFLSLQGESDALSYQALDDSLAYAEQLRASMAANATQYLNWRYNTIYALSVRGDAQGAIALAIESKLDVYQMPAYVRHALANAYLAQRQPRQAQQLYESLLHEKNYPDIELYSSLYYAYIEQENYAKAQRLVKAVDQLIPVFIYSHAKGVDKTTAADRYEYMSLQGLNLAYRNQLSQAEQHYQALLAKAPDNETLRNDLVKIQRWRGLPLTAQQNLARLNGRMPIDKATQINQMQNDQALENISAWRADLMKLLQLYPTDSSVMLSRKQLHDREHFSIQHESMAGKSSTDKLNPNLKASRDLDTETRINSPWMNENYRVFALYQTRMGEYEQNKIQEQRYGAGMEWAAQRKNFSLALSQNNKQQDFGVDLSWSHWLNDHWQYQLQYNSRAPIALQALAEHAHGQRFAADVLWKQNESRAIQAGYQQTQSSDDNRQHIWSAAWTERVWARPHHLVDARLSSEYGKNTLDNAVYFNPSAFYQVDFSLQYDWLTWRKYERDFYQKFTVGAGIYAQQDYANKAIVHAQYLHQWSLSRTWNLQYGIGWSRRAYDGQMENNVYGLLGFEGVF